MSRTQGHDELTALRSDGVGGCRGWRKTGLPGRLAARLFASRRVARCLQAHPRSHPRHCPPRRPRSPGRGQDRAPFRHLPKPPRLPPERCRHHRLRPRQRPPRPRLALILPLQLSSFARRPTLSKFSIGISERRGYSVGEWSAFCLRRSLLRNKS